MSIDVLGAATRVASDVIADPPVSGGGGVLGFVNNLSDEVSATIKAVVTVVAIIFVVFKAIKSAFAVSTIVISLLVAGVLVWGVNSISWLQGRVEEEVTNNSAPASLVVGWDERV